VTSSPGGRQLRDGLLGELPRRDERHADGVGVVGTVRRVERRPLIGQHEPDLHAGPEREHATTATFGSRPLAFIESTLPDGNVGADYTAFINTTGGSGGPDEFSLVAGSLPDGLQMAKSPAGRRAAQRHDAGGATRASRAARAWRARGSGASCPREPAPPPGVRSAAVTR
jgi:hypothetical protein